MLKRFYPVWLENIAHHLGQSDVKHAAYLYNTSAQFFPEETIHLVAVDCSPVKHSHISIIFQNGQWLVSFKNELLSHIKFTSDAKYAELPVSQFRFHPTFAELDIYPEVVRMIRENNIELGKLPPIANTISADRLVGNLLRGKVIHVDSNENIISDITREEFNDAHAKNNKGKFQILYRRKGGISRIHEHYDNLQPGEALAFFNSSGYIEIAQNMGNASSILGVKTGDHIIIEFDDK
jgi:S-adenosylmethionine hydrolase